MVRTITVALVLMTSLTGCYVSTKPVFEGPGAETSLTDGTYNCEMANASYKAQFVVTKQAVTPADYTYAFTPVSTKDTNVDPVSDPLVTVAKRYIHISGDFYGVSEASADFQENPVYINMLAIINGSSIRYITADSSEETQALEKNSAAKAGVELGKGMPMVPDVSVIKVETNEDQEKALQYFASLAEALKDANNLARMDTIADCQKM